MNIPCNSGHMTDNEWIEVATVITGTWSRVGTRIYVDAYNSVFPLFFCITWFPSQSQVNEADIYVFTNPFMFAVHERNGCALRLKSSCIGGGQGTETVNDLCKNAKKEQSRSESKSRSGDLNKICSPWAQVFD